MLSFLFSILCSFQDPDADAAIAKFRAAMSKAKNSADQSDALFELGKTKDEKTLAVLTPYITGQENLRRIAIHTVSGFYEHQKKVVPILLKSLQANQSDSIAVSAALEGLGRIGDETVVPTVHKYIPDKTRFVAQAAIAAVGRLRNASSIEPLIQALRAQERALANAGSGAVGPVVPGPTGGSIKPDASIRKTAEILQTEANPSLNKITRQDFKTSADWQKWWDANKATFQVEK